MTRRRRTGRSAAACPRGPDRRRDLADAGADRGLGHLAYAIVERVAPDGTVTEAFAWLATAVAVGAAVGAAGAGAIAEQAGPAAVFVFAGGAGACALMATLTRSATVPACQTS
jgi:predicted MFS family arabinose efflux permease